MNCALKPSPRVTRSSGSAFANGGNSLAAPMRALSVASTSSASRRPLTVEGRRTMKSVAMKSLLFQEVVLLSLSS